MWLSRVWRRGCVRLRMTFSIGRTITGWGLKSSASIEAAKHRDDFMKATLREGDPHQLLHQGDLFMPTVKPSTYKSKIQKTNDG